MSLAQHIIDQLDAEHEAQQEAATEEYWRNRYEDELYEQEKALEAEKARDEYLTAKFDRWRDRLFFDSEAELSDTDSEQ
jgi:hypothetical protein